MTSGEFTLFPTENIFVNRDRRQRRELKDIDELANSIAKTGLIHPPVIQRSGELRVGERRFEAIKRLNWLRCPVQFIEDLDEHELQLVELEENIKRLDLEWQEECAAVERYHRMKLKTEPEWNKAKSAEMLGVSKSYVSDRIAVAKELDLGNERVTNAPPAPHTEPTRTHPRSTGTS